MILWIVFLVFQLTLAMTALIASGAARKLARLGWYDRAEAFGTMSYCLYILLGVIFICAVSSDLSILGLGLTAVWVLMAGRELYFVRLLPA